MTRRLSPLFIALLALCLGCLAAKPARADTPIRDRVRDRVRALRVAKLVDLLDLDEKTATRLFPALNRYDTKIAELHKKSGQIARKMRALIETDQANNKNLNKLIDALLVNRRQIQKIEDQRIKDVRAVLSPAQVAKLVLVLPEIDRQIRQRIRRALRERGQRRRGGPGRRTGRELDPFR